MWCDRAREKPIAARSGSVLTPAASGRGYASIWPIRRSSKVSLFRAQAVMPEAQKVVHLIEQLWLAAPEAAATG
jgi:hypothetical protein